MIGVLSSTIDDRIYLNWHTAGGNYDYDDMHIQDAVLVWSIPGTLYFQSRTLVWSAQCIRLVM